MEKKPKWAKDANLDGPIYVMSAGLPGEMMSSVARKILNEEDPWLRLSRGGLSLETDDKFKLGEFEMQLYGLRERKDGTKNWHPDIIVDFTEPDSVNKNAEFYCECGIPFVMGTTGGDRKCLVETVETSDISAVIAPNMATPIVFLQALMEYGAKEFSGVLGDFHLAVTESHQHDKKDTSGTAKAMIQYFEALGVTFKGNITMIRDPDIQVIELGIPLEHIGGHGHHGYSLRSIDGTVFIQLTHNVEGRDVYAKGTLAAIRFLATHLNEKGKVFSMIDILKG